MDLSWWLVLDPKFLAQESALGLELLQELALFQGFKMSALMEDAIATIGVPRDWCKIMLSSNALIVTMVQTRGLMLNSEMG